MQFKKNYFLFMYFKFRGECVCGGQQKAYQSQFSLSTIECLKFRSLGFQHHVFIFHDLSFRPIIYLNQWPFKELVPLGRIPTIVKIRTFMQYMCPSRSHGVSGWYANESQSEKSVNYDMYKNM